MKEDIHPKYVECKVTCGCGNSFVTRATVAALAVEVCSSCHPFYTGQQRYVDTAGRVEKFQKKYRWDARQAVTAAEAQAEAQRKRNVPPGKKAPARKPPMPAKRNVPPGAKAKKPKPPAGDEPTAPGKKPAAPKAAAQAAPKKEPPAPAPAAEAPKTDPKPPASQGDA
jgi:large subunit ribosomal protein L31